MNAKAISENVQSSGCVRIGVFLFGLVFAGFALAFLWLAVVAPALNVQAANAWSESQCRITSSKVKSTSNSDGTSYSPEIKYEFEVAGKKFHGDRPAFSKTTGSSKWAHAIVNSYRPGETYPCFYNPDDPGESVLNREMDWSFNGFYLPTIIVGVFAFIGFSICAIAVFFMGKKSRNPSPAFAAATTTSTTANGVGEIAPAASKADEADQLDQAWSVPKKLKPEQSKWIVFLITLGVAIFWNGIVSAFILALIFDDVGNWGRIGMGLILTPFALIGLLLVSAVVYMFMALFNPIFEIAISSGAVALGREVDIAWQIEGKARRIRKLKLEIQGEQSATYRRGTTTHTDTEIFELIPVCEVTTQSEIEFGSSTVLIPDSTMHTFDGDHNNVRWRIVVQGEIPLWPDVNATHSFRVKPRDRQA